MKITHNGEEIRLRSRLPVIPLRDVVIFPHTIYPLLIGRKFTMRALQDAMAHDKQVVLVTQRTSSQDEPKAEDLFTVGVVARILQVMKMPNGTLKVLVEGMVRAELKAVTQSSGHLVSRIELQIRDQEKADRETEALGRT